MRTLAATAGCLVLALWSGPTALQAQAPFEIVTEGRVPEQVIRATSDALVASFVHLRDIQGPALPGMVTVTLHERTETFRAALETRGLRVPPGSWLPTGQPFPLAFHLDISRMRVPTSNVNWFVPHELFHVVQWHLVGVTGPTHIGHPRNRGFSVWMMEGTAEVFKLKVLETRGIARYAATVRDLRAAIRTVTDNCRAWPTMSSTEWYQQIDRCGNSTTIYNQAFVMAAYLFDTHGGWPKVFEYLAADVADSATRFAGVYGITLADFDAEFRAFVGQ